MVQRTIVVNQLTAVDLIEFSVEPRWYNRPLDYILFLIWAQARHLRLVPTSVISGTDLSVPKKQTIWEWCHNAKVAILWNIYEIQKSARWQ